MPAPWTRPERTALRYMWRKGLPPAVIATSLQAQFGHRYRAADIPGRVRDFGFMGEHPAAPPQPEAPPPEVVAAPPVEAVNVAPDRNRWPDAAVERLTTMWQDGASGGAIAAALTEEFGAPRTRSAVMGMVHRLGLGKRRRVVAEIAASPGGEVENPGGALSEAPQALSSPPDAAPGDPPMSLFSSSDEAAKTDTPPEPKVTAQPEPTRQLAPARASTTKTAPKYARDHAPPPALALVRAEPRPADWPPADGIPMADLRWGECRWAVSDFRAVQHRFCAAPASGDSPYCAAHRTIALQAREPGRRPGRYPGWVADGGVA